MAGRAPPGQNALSGSAAARVVRLAGIERADLVLDIGAGAGALTLPIARRARHVIAVEPDERLAARLEDRCRALGNVVVVRRDARVMPLPRDPFRVVANPPFAMTSVLLRKLLDPLVRAQRLDLVLGEGVVRLFASRHPGRVMPLEAAPWWTFRYGARIRASEFFPPPGSDAAVLVAIRRDPPLLEPSLRGLHGRLVRMGLSDGSRPLRRVLRASLSDRTWSRLATKEGIPRDARAGALGGPQWAAVTAAVAHHERCPPG